MNYKGKKIGVLMGGFGSEREVSLKSGKAVLDSLLKLGHNAVGIDVQDDFLARLASEKIDVAFVVLHGPVGEDGIVQGALELARIPYTGSGVAASALAFDKRIARRIFDADGIPGAKWEEVNAKSGSTMPAKIKAPLVVKPSRQGSTVGISIVKKDDPDLIADAMRMAFEYDEWVVVEEFIDGAELTIGVLDGEALGCVEIRAEGGFYDYERKYTPGHTQYLAPAPISKEMTQRLRELSAKAYKALGCRGAARADFRLDAKGEPKILEVNTIPGMTSTSLLPKSAAIMGMDFDALVAKMLEGAKNERPQ